ncbi:unnamed protein product [Brassica oleracea]
MTSPSLPLELVEDVLYKIPIESLVRFKSVSKDWHALIKDKRFIYKLLDLSHERCILVGHKAIQLSSMKINNAPLCVPAPEKLHDYTLKAIIHCDGLLLCKCDEGGEHDNGRKLAVWNPFVSRLKWIEPSTYYKYFDVFAFGYDSVSRDNYKILRIDMGIKTEIYEFRSKLWRRVRATVDEYHRLCQAMSMNGNMYWVAQTKSNDSKIEFIQSFDFSTETFKPICVPEETDRFHGFTVHRVLLSGYGGDRLSLLQQHAHLKIEVWVTNKLTDGDVSWSNYFNVTLAHLPILPYRNDCRFLAYCIHKTKKIMLWVEEVDYNEAYVYTDVYVMGEGEIDKQVEATITRTLHDQSCNHVYVPSLVPVPD